MAYYRRIRDMREDHDLTQRQVAVILQMPFSTFSICFYFIISARLVLPSR